MGRFGYSRGAGCSEKAFVSLRGYRGCVTSYEVTGGCNLAHNAEISYIAVSSLLSARSGSLPAAKSIAGCAPFTKMRYNDAP